VTQACGMIFQHLPWIQGISSFHCFFCRASLSLWASFFGDTWCRRILRRKFHCDRSTLTISRVRWLDIHNNKDWHTRSYPLADIANIRYQAVARTGGKGGNLRSPLYRRRQDAEVLPGIEPRQADRILKALKAFGADVPADFGIRTRGLLSPI